MTQLPDRKVLDGSKLPKTTTGEMKEAFGQLRDFLADLLGKDSTDKEAARKALGIDLEELVAAISAKAGPEDVDAALRDTVSRSELDDRLQALREEMAEKGVPVGTVAYFAVETPPSGYLKADGSEVGRATYPALFAAIGTTFGEGDGEMTFNLPDLMGRFPEGSATPGTVKAPGLPNITGNVATLVGANSLQGAFHEVGRIESNVNKYSIPNGAEDYLRWAIDASLSNPIYGASSTVQPPALTLLPCIRAVN